MFAADQPMAFDGHIVGGGGRASSIETGTKLYVSNLDYGVSNEDIKVFFLEFFVPFRCLVSLEVMPRILLV